MTKHYNIPIFVPHLGCPNECSFCNQLKITGISTNITSKNVSEIIEAHLRTLPNDALIEVAFFGGSFTAIDKNIQESLLDTANQYIKKGRVSGIRISTRPDAIDKQTLDLLKEKGVKTIELGVQSLDDKVLKLSERGHDSICVKYASDMIKSYSFKLGHQLMPGLPGDSFEKSFNTAIKSISMAPDFMRIYPTLVIKNTKLEDMFLNGGYKPLSLNDSIKISALIYSLAKYENIDVIRIGLQATESINPNKDVVAGPFHLRFGQLVLGRYIADLISHALILQNIKFSNTLIIKISNKYVTSLAGLKKELEEKFNINEIKIYGKKTNDNTIHVESNNIETLIDTNKAIKSVINSYLEEGLTCI